MRNRQIGGGGIALIGFFIEKINQYMIALLAEFIDWYVLQCAWTLRLKSVRKRDVPNAKQAEALEFLNGPDFIPSESKPAKIEFNRELKRDKPRVHFKFPAPRPCEFTENSIVDGRH